MSQFLTEKGYQVFGLVRGQNNPKTKLVSDENPSLELVEGETILDHCRSRHVTVRERIELFLAVLDAVAFAHQRGIVHRDLKPANILVSSRGEAKLLDFGIAKLVAQPGGDETHTMRRAMTPAYASPEQLRGERVGPASDIYSLGVVLYELLAGVSPYRVDSRTFEAIEDAIRSQEPEPPSSPSPAIHTRLSWATILSASRS